MARVHTAKASKDYPKQGILKGQTYYWWQLFKQPKQMSLTRPKGSQLTGSGKISEAREAFEALEVAINEAKNPEDIIDALNECADAIQSVADEYRESKENMPESLQESPTAQQCEENADSLESAKSEIEDAVTEIENMGAADFIDDGRLETLASDQLQEEFEGREEDYEEDQDAWDVRLQELTEAIKEFGDLSVSEQQGYMETAGEHANGVSCPL